jgi:hypothetical protein
MVTTHFEHEPLNFSDTECCTRLLQLLGRRVDGVIRCSIINKVRLDQHPIPAYTAVSYEWGNPTDREQIIELNKLPFQIGHNLHEFLGSLIDSGAASDHAYLWIDAICIDQRLEKMKERNYQVGQMKVIYSNAQRVLAYLGPAATHSDQLFDLINESKVPETQYHVQTASSVPGGRDPGSYRMKYGNNAERTKFWSRCRISAASASDTWARDAFRELSYRSYWRRMWIIEEILLPRRLLLMCGTRIISWADWFCKACLPSKDSGDIFGLPWAIPRDSPAFALLSERDAYLQKQTLGPLDEALTKFRASLSTRYHDKIYALLGLTTTGHLVEVDYDSTKIDLLYAVLRSVVMHTREKTHQRQDSRQSHIVSLKTLFIMLAILKLDAADFVNSFTRDVSRDHMNRHTGSLMKTKSLRQAFLDAHCKAIWEQELMDEKKNSPGPPSMRFTQFHVEMSGMMGLRVYFEARAILHNLWHRKPSQRHDQSLWSVLSSLGHQGRIKLCNCRHCSDAWLLWRMTGEVNFDFSQQPHHMQTSKESIVSLYKAVVETEAKSLLFYKNASSTNHSASGVQLYLASGVFVAREGLSAGLGFWENDTIARTQLEGYTLLLHSDPDMVATHLLDSSSYALGATPFSIQQLTHLAAHMHPGRVSVRTETGKIELLGPQCSSLEELKDVSFTIAT